MEDYSGKCTTVLSQRVTHGATTAGQEGRTLTVPRGPGLWTFDKTDVREGTVECVALEERDRSGPRGDMRQLMEGGTILS